VVSLMLLGGSDVWAEQRKSHPTNCVARGRKGKRKKGTRANIASCLLGVIEN